MKSILTEQEALRLEKLIWLYCVEVGDEGPCSSNGSDIPTPEELTMVLIAQGLEIDVESITAIMNKELAISDEFAEAVEKAFMMSPGWLIS